MLNSEGFWSYFNEASNLANLNLSITYNSIYSRMDALDQKLSTEISEIKKMLISLHKHQVEDRNRRSLSEAATTSVQQQQQHPQQQSKVNTHQSLWNWGYWGCHLHPHQFFRQNGLKFGLFWNQMNELRAPSCINFDWQIKILPYLGWFWHFWEIWNHHFSHCFQNKPNFTPSRFRDWLTTYIFFVYF